MALVSPSQSNPGDQITAASINNPVNQLATAVNGNIDANNIANNAVTTAKLADGSVGASKLSTSSILLAYVPLTSNFTTSSTTPVQAPGLTATVSIPAGGRAIKITAYTSRLYSATASARADITIWDGTVGTGTQLQMFSGEQTGAGTNGACAIVVVTPSAGSKTYNVGLNASSGVANLEGASTRPAFLLVEVL